MTPVGECWFDKLRAIVKNRQADKVHGNRIDAYTASVLVSIYDRLNAENRAKFESLSLPRAVALVWKIAGKV